VPKVTVLMSDEAFEQLDRYCKRDGYKKSTLIVRLVREHLEREGFQKQTELRFPGQSDASDTGAR
jgi:metal-responsive CopG/Arc/MetJ family transcriptional regulator